MTATQQIIQLTGQEITTTALVLPDGMEYEDWVETLATLGRAERACQWWIGDALNYGERAYGQKYSEALEVTGLDYQTVANYKYVAAHVEFSLRKENLKWHHHLAVAKCEPDEQFHWLKEAEANGWSVAELRKAMRASEPPPPLGPGVYDIIYADPPWEYQNSGLLGSAEQHYNTIPTDDLCELLEHIGLNVAENAVLFMWVTNPLLEDGLRVLNAWGFAYKTNLCWVKNRETYGKLGFYTYGQHELLLIGARGSYLPVEKVSSVVTANKGEHSAKPLEFYSIIETMYPNGAYLELFARHPERRPGWEYWGNQADA